ncbi:hypothetical protein CC86DRAFT_386590 [Ophiobolus disseminans]|uniref:Hydrophobin n=1 Tax=Ophiobolus disseminans TaxID=1469910 RepID=A0A6A6ZJH0_9PLEO|nr:hypothetical protein CC86DRAFT_386590 [Ophiobolus disseminans]
MRFSLPILALLTTTSLASPTPVTLVARVDCSSASCQALVNEGSCLLDAGRNIIKLLKCLSDAGGVKNIVDQGCRRVSVCGVFAGSIWGLSESAGSLLDGGMGRGRWGKGTWKARRERGAGNGNSVCEKEDNPFETPQYKDAKFNKSQASPGRAPEQCYYQRKVGVHQSNTCSQYKSDD